MLDRPDTELNEGRLGDYFFRNVFADCLRRNAQFACGIYDCGVGLTADNNHNSLSSNLWEYTVDPVGSGHNEPTDGTGGSNLTNQRDIVKIFFIKILSGG
jgi:hypothetical protein